MDVIIIKILFSFLLSFLFSFYLTPLLCVLAQRLQFVDRPDGVIKIHQYAVPYLGGVAVYGGFLGALALVAPFDSNIFLLTVGTTLLLILGLIDDLIVLKAYQKFFGQFVVALCFLRAGFYLKQHIFYNFWNFPLSLFWILSIVNAFNLVDVMDGLATLLGIIATLTFIVIALYLHNNVVLVVLGAFLGALIAFFWYNKPPARIYLGDAGSLFLGGFLATTPFLLDWGTYNSYGFLAPPIVLGIPLLEAFSLIVIRSYKRIPFYKGSPHHFSSYLLANKWNREKILGYIFLMSLYSGIIAFLFTINVLSISSTIGAGLLFLIVWIAVLLRN